MNDDERARVTLRVRLNAAERRNAELLEDIEDRKRIAALVTERSMELELRNAALLDRLKAADERIAKLEARIKSARPIFIEHIRQCVNGGSNTCYLCKDTNAWLDEAAKE